MFLGQRCELIENRFALSFVSLTICQQILKAYAAMRSDSPKGNVSVLEKLYKMRARDVQKIRRLLRCELCLNRNDGHGIAIRHLP